MANNEYDIGGVWILAQQNNGEIEPVSFELLTRANELAAQCGGLVCCVVLGDKIADIQLQSLIDAGANRVVAVEEKCLANFTVEPYSQALISVIDTFKPEILLAAATSLGRVLMPFVAIKANTGLTADCTQLAIEKQSGNLLQTRPAIGGNILATIKTPNHRPQMATIRPHSTPRAKLVEGRSGEIIRYKLSEMLKPSAIERIDFIHSKEQQSISDSEKVVVVGRGIKKGENIPLIFALAEQLDAAVGATRDVVDRGWLSYRHQVGLSGHTINPKLYIGVGVSGTIQHLAGMQTAERIIAINTDPYANIFKIANVGIVGDLFDVVPAIIDELKNGGRI